MTVPTRTALIAGNWKMHYGPKSASSFTMETLPALGQIVLNYPQIIGILCPPAISLSAVREVPISSFLTEYFVPLLPE